MSYNCDMNVKDDGKEEQQQETEAEEIRSDEMTNVNQELRENVRPNESSVENMDYEEKAKGLKRYHVTDSDSTSEMEPTRRSKLRPAPNLSTRKKDKKSPSACGLPL